MSSVEAVFRSRSHPMDVSRAALFGTALVRPLGVSMVPIMIGALIAMLEGRPPIPWLYLGFPLAMAVSAAWTVLQLRRETVELRVMAESVQAYSAWEAATPRASVGRLALVDIRREGGLLSLTIGHDTRVLELSRWPDANALQRALEDAGTAFASRVRESVGP
jgi:hypothetical protein